MAIVELDIQEFKSFKPQFVNLTDAQIESAFSVAALYVDNTVTSKIPYDPANNVDTRKWLMYLMMCHLLTLDMRGNVTGAVTNATEGSVSTGFQALPTTTAGQAWYNQTPCGAAYYQLMMPFMLGGRLYNGCFR